MPGKQARVLCPVCQEPIPPDETECGNCGAFVMDEAVVRLSRALGLDRERALKLFEAGFRHPKQLRDRDPNRVLEKGEVGLLFICTNCGAFVAGGDTKCPRCAAEFEADAEEAPAEEEDILDLVLCPACGADNDPDLVECEICGESLRERATKPVVAAAPKAPVPAPKVPAPEGTLAKVDDFLRESEKLPPETRVKRVSPERPAVTSPAPPRMSTSPSAVRRETPGIKRPAAVKPSAPPVPKPISASPKVPASSTLQPIPVTRPRPRPVESNAKPAPPEAQLGRLDVRMEPRKVTVTPRPTARPQLPSGFEKQGAVARKNIRPVTSAMPGLSPETFGGLVLAAATSLLLSGVLNQHLVSLGIAAVLLGIGAFQSAGFLRSRTARPNHREMGLLLGGALIGLAGAILRDSPVVLATALALGAGLPFGAATSWILRKPYRALLAIASVVPIAAQAVVHGMDPAFRPTLLWILGIGASMPWPAALAATEVLRRRSAVALRRQLVRAERNVERKDYERSLAEYDRAIAAAPTDVPGAEIPWYGKGATLVLLGRYEEALRAIDTALDINPQNEVAWVNKGNALTRLGRLIDALRCFNAAIKVNPQFEVAWNNKGNALARLGKFEDALRCYDRALKIDPGYRGAWVNMGFVLTKMGRFDEAASCADEALRLDRGRAAESA